MLSVPLKSDISLLRFAAFEMTVGRSGIHVIHVFFHRPVHHWRHYEKPEKSVRTGRFLGETVWSIEGHFLQAFLSRRRLISSWVLGRKGFENSERIERAWDPELLCIHLCEMACSRIRNRVFFCGHSPDLFHALICSLLYRIGKKMGIGNIEIMFADFGGMEGRTMSFIDTFSREFIENVRKIHRLFPISSSLMVQ